MFSYYINHQSFATQTMRRMFPDSPRLAGAGCDQWQWSTRLRGTPRGKRSEASVHQRRSSSRPIAVSNEAATSAWSSSRLSNGLLPAMKRSGGEIVLAGKSPSVSGSIDARFRAPRFKRKNPRPQAVTCRAQGQLSELGARVASGTGQVEGQRLWHSVARHVGCSGNH